MRLGFYINPAIKLRSGSSSNEPDPTVVSSLAEISGAEIILVGWNPSGGLITKLDVQLLRNVVKCDIIFIVPNLVDHVNAVVKLRPSGVAIVGETWDGVSSEVPPINEYDMDDISPTLKEYKDAGVPASIWIEPDIDLVKSVARLYGDGVVLDCGSYSNSETDAEAASTLSALDNASMAASKFGLVTAYSHGLHYRNIGPIAGLQFGDEIYIGNAIICHSIVHG
ncbi:pyridoxine 5'-phosphate synthase, partial [bacterium]|nr:pyridoxine 5'-phosphate synthase [bacterium]